MTWKCDNKGQTTYCYEDGTITGVTTSSAIPITLGTSQVLTCSPCTTSSLPSTYQENIKMDRCGISIDCTVHVSALEQAGGFALDCFGLAVLIFAIACSYELYKKSNHYYNKVTSSRKK